MTIKVFASGQSNMLGRNTGGPSMATVSSSVQVWNNINPMGANGSAFVTAAAAQAAGTFELTDRNNLAVWFCDKLAKRYFTTVTLTLVARGGTPISNWAPGASPSLLQESIDVWTATGQAPADVFIWHQGEADTATATATYIAAFETLLANLTANGVINASTVIVVGGIAEASDVYIGVNNAKLRLIANKLNRGYASSYGLTTTDGAHFTGVGLYTLGALRYFSAYKFATRK